MRLLLLVLASVCVAGCTDEIDPHATTVKPGRIVSPVDPLTFQIPAEAMVGVPTEMLLATFGDSCFHAERTDVVESGADWVVRPYDRSPRDIGCDDSLWSVEHRFTIVFAAPGDSAIIIDGATYEDEPLRVVAATVTVR